MEYNHTRHAKKTWLDTEPCIDVVIFFFCCVFSSFPSILLYLSLCFSDRELHQGEHEGRDGSTAAERCAQPHGGHVGNGHEPSLPDGRADTQTYWRWNAGKDSENTAVATEVCLWPLAVSGMFFCCCCLTFFNLKCCCSASETFLMLNWSFSWAIVVGNCLFRCEVSRQFMQILHFTVIVPKVLIYCSHKMTCSYFKMTKIKVINQLSNNIFLN